MCSDLREGRACCIRRTERRPSRSKKQSGRTWGQGEAENLAPEEADSLPLPETQMFPLAQGPLEGGGTFQITQHQSGAQALGDRSTSDHRVLVDSQRLEASHWCSHVQAEGAGSRGRGHWGHCWDWASRGFHQGFRKVYPSRRGTFKIPRSCFSLCCCFNVIFQALYYFLGRKSGILTESTLMWRVRGIYKAGWLLLSYK